VLFGVMPIARSNSQDASKMPHRRRIIEERVNGTKTPATPQGLGLSDYSQVKPGRENQAQWIYIDPQTQRIKYSRVTIDTGLYP
jgi:hypothetical protein